MTEICAAGPGEPANHDARRTALIERLGTFADMCSVSPLPGDAGDVAYDLIRQAAAQISSDRCKMRRTTAIVAETEARIVAWLRRHAEGELSNNMHVMRAAQAFLSAIEAGEHKEPTL